MYHVTLQETKAEYLAEKKLKEESKEKLIDDLMFSDGDASAIVSKHKESTSTQMSAIRQTTTAAGAAVTFSTGVSSGGANVIDAEARLAALAAEAEPYVYRAPQYERTGPPAPGERELPSSGHLAAVRAAEMAQKAGGYSEVIPCARALQEAMCGLYLAK